MRKRTIALLTVLAVVLAVAIAIGEGNKVYTLYNFSGTPLQLKCDTTQAVNDTVHTSTPVAPVELGRIYQFIVQIDSVASQSTSTALKASDSTSYQIKVQSRFGELANYFWNDVFAIATGGTGADTGTWIVEKVLFLAADTTTGAGLIGDQLRVVVTITDSMTSAIAAGTPKRDRVYGSVQVAVRE